MELVYPIYLDFPMMSAFLASLENGLVQEANITETATDAKQDHKSKHLELSAGGMLSGIFGVKAGGEDGQTTSIGGEFGRSGVVKYPDASLFIRLREILKEKDLIKPIASLDDVDKARYGDLVEFKGRAYPSPGYQIGRAFGQLMPMIEPINNMQIAQYDQFLANTKNSPVGPDHYYKSKGELNSSRDSVIALKEVKRIETQLFNGMGGMIETLFAKDSMESLVMRSDDVVCICQLYPEMARNGKVHDIYDCNWNGIGKVVGRIGVEETFDLFKGSPISYVAQAQIGELTKAINTESLKISVEPPTVKGPAIIIALLALFA